MHWLLAGCCGLALIISVAPNLDVPILQNPRFYYVKTGHNVSISCRYAWKHLSAKVEWFKAWKYDVKEQDRVLMNADKGILSFNSHADQKILSMLDVRTEDSGVYYCKLNDTWGPGSELKVYRAVNVPRILHRTRVKDGLIILQGLLLATCIATLLLRKRQLLNKQDSIYEEPETDHIYEGLAIETCGGGLYEELTVYAQADGAEAPWE